MNKYSTECHKSSPRAIICGGHCPEPCGEMSSSLQTWVCISVGLRCVWPVCQGIYLCTPTEKCLERCSKKWEQWPFQVNREKDQEENKNSAFYALCACTYSPLERLFITCRIRNEGLKSKQIK
jgi:hypothetical protein